MSKFPVEYTKEELGNPDEIYNPKYRFDSRGNLVLPITPYQRQILETSPGSKDVKMGMGSDKDYPLNDPASIKSGYLHVSVGIKTGTKGGWVTEMSGGDSAYPIRYYNEGTGTAKFYVDDKGNVYMSGEIQADSGYIGGWLIGEHTITAETGVCGLNSEVTAGVDWRFWSGNVTPGSSNFRVDDTGKVYCADIVITGGTINGLAAGTEISIQGWMHDMAFSATDHDTVAWTSGTITLLDGTTYSIGAQAFNISAITYIYFDVDISTTALQASYTPSNAVGSGKILIAVAEDVAVGKKVIFQVFGGKALGGVGKLLVADNIAAGSITANLVGANEIIANTANIADAVITSAKISSLNANVINAGTITAILIRTAASNGRVELVNAGAYSDYITFYDPNGDLTGFITAAGGGTDTLIISNPNTGSPSILFQIGGVQKMEMYPGYITIDDYLVARDIEPVSNGGYYLGTNVKRWGNVYTNQICLNGVCRTTWPSSSAFSCTDLGSCNLNQIGTRAHGSLTGVTADQHHSQSHSHGSHTGIGADNHHSSLSWNLSIVPFSVTTGQLLPVSPGSSNIGNSSNNWDNVYLDSIYKGTEMKLDMYTDSVRCSENFFPASAGSQSLGDTTHYWANIAYKTLEDVGCLGVFDEGVELQDGTIVSDIEALKSIKKDPIRKTVYGVPRFDYKTMPKAVYKKGHDGKGNILPRDDKDRPYEIDEKTKKRVYGEDGAETTALISIMIGAIKELDKKYEELSKKIN